MKQFAIFGLMTFLGVVQKWAKRIFESISFVESRNSSALGVKAYIVFGKSRPYQELFLYDRHDIPGDQIRSHDVHRITITLASNDSDGVKIDRLLAKFEKRLTDLFGTGGFERLYPQVEEQDPGALVLRESVSRRRWVISYWARGPIPVSELRVCIADRPEIEDLSLKLDARARRSSRFLNRWALAVMAFFPLAIIVKNFLPDVAPMVLLLPGGTYLVGIIWLDLLFFHELVTNLRARLI